VLFLVFFHERVRSLQKDRDCFMPRSSRASSAISMMISNSLVAAAPSAAAAATTTAPVTARLRPRTGLGDGQSASVDLFAVQGGHGCLGFVVLRELDEPEALRAPGAPVRDDRNRVRAAVAPEELTEVVLGRGVGKIADVQFHPNSSCRRASSTRRCPDAIAAARVAPSRFLIVRNSSEQVWQSERNENEVQINTPPARSA